MNIKCLKGTKDILWPEVEVWQRLEVAVKKIFDLYSYREIRTPIIENTTLFSRSIGQGTDIVQKEMYSFKDKGDREISLRPEETASVVRAYLEHEIFRGKAVAKFYYIGPMFRSERPQAGRMRQFHQIGVEAIGAKTPYLDAEVILLLNDILKQLKVRNYLFKLNNLGCIQDRVKYKNVLKKAVEPHLKELCSDCKKRYELNILRVMDCKNENCRPVISCLPVIRDFLCKECQDHFVHVLNLLDKFVVPKETDEYLVRGLDYYTGTTFEVRAENLGANDAVAAGGRYDNLVEELGGPKTGACGFAIGIERLIASMAQEDNLIENTAPFVYVVCLDKIFYPQAFELMMLLRNNKISTEMDYLGRSLKSQMRQANSIGAKYVIIIGEDEIKTGSLTIKDMTNARQQKITQDNLADFFLNAKKNG